MSEYLIERVPMPAMHTSRGESKYPFAKMEVGDSFWLPRVDKQRVYAAVQNHRRRYAEMAFTVRADGDGFRCYRKA